MALITESLDEYGRFAVQKNIFCIIAWHKFSMECAMIGITEIASISQSLNHVRSKLVDVFTMESDSCIFLDSKKSKVC